MDTPRLKPVIIFLRGADAILFMVIGAFNSKLLAVDSVAILPAEMSKERFEWLSKIAGQVIATPGCESNVKEIFDKTWELKQDPSMMIFNQSNRVFSWSLISPVKSISLSKIEYSLTNDSK